MSRPILMTSRIRLEPMTTEHLPLLAELDADAEVLRYILGRARDTSQICEFWEPICADNDADAVGLGWWIGRRLSDGEFLGWWDLSPSEPLQQHPSLAEAGWRLARRHWRQGYATEGGSEGTRAWLRLVIQPAVPVEGAWGFAIKPILGQVVRHAGLCLQVRLPYLPGPPPRLVCRSEGERPNRKA